MKASTLLALTLLGFCCSSLSAQEAKVWTKEELQKLYTDFLTAEGFRSEVDEDGDVVFKREGKTYFIGVDAEDPQFFRVVYPNFWEIESFEEHVRVLIAADVSNNRSKVSKVFIVEENTWGSVELFVERPEDFKAVFYRCLAAVDNGVKNFVAHMRGDDVQ